MGEAPCVERIFWCDLEHVHIRLSGCLRTSCLVSITGITGSSSSASARDSLLRSSAAASAPPINQPATIGDL